jgi:predicted transcriptional regulator
MVPALVPLRYHEVVAMNLRLTPEVASALQAEAERTGRSQQEILREAVSRHLHLVDDERPEGDRDRARAAQVVRPARVPYRKVKPRLRLPKDTSSLDLLDRDDRF